MVAVSPSRDAPRIGRAVRSSLLTNPYVAVEPFHLDRYIDEQVFRYNNRATKENPLTDADRFSLALTQLANKRLTYAELTGKTAGGAAATQEPF